MSAEPKGTRSAPMLWPHEGLTVADVDALSDCPGGRGELIDGVRFELVDGVLKGMTRVSIGHQEVLLELNLALRATTPPGSVVIQGLGVVLAEDQRAVPDLVVIRTSDHALSDVPAERVVLVAEVVSTSTRSTDRFVKPALYAQAGIPCYLRVELDPAHIVAYRLDADGVYEEVGRAEPGQILTLDAPFPISIDPAALVR